jgi:O-antigen/teichoic acid export membrane protein
LTFWVGSAISPPPVLLVSLAIWAVLNSLIGPLSMLLIGLNAIRFAAITGVIMAIANIAISIALVSRIGVAGAIIGTIVAQVAFILLPGWAHARRLLKDAARSPSAPALSPRA